MWLVFTGSSIFTIVVNTTTVVAPTVIVTTIKPNTASAAHVTPTTTAYYTSTIFALLVTLLALATLNTTRNTTISTISPDFAATITNSLTRVRYHDPYESDTASEGEVHGVAAVNKTPHRWDYDPAVDPWLLTQVNPSCSETPRPPQPPFASLSLDTSESQQQTDVVRLRGGVWTEQCRRNSTPLDRETSASANVVNRSVNADSAKGVLGGGDMWDEQREGPEYNNQQLEQENPSLANNWLVNKGKKMNLNPKSSVTSIVMFKLYDKCVTVNKQDSWVDYMVAAFEGDEIETSVYASTPGRDASLADAAEIVCKGDAKEQALGFMNMLSIINFRIRVEQCVDLVLQENASN
ncbi:hypothetical protein AAF712_008260 [Marasmius tenuissimus]|uniref:Uncharacterized protein n=1 Tax=Marasmius tenuissimus TaxID=585030 RepID=A0ABR2ZSS2_9AGAR